MQQKPVALSGKMDSISQCSCCNSLLHFYPSRAGSILGQAYYVSIGDEVVRFGETGFMITPCRVNGVRISDTSYRFSKQRLSMLVEYQSRWRLYGR
jgi:hypothetical protein